MIPSSSSKKSASVWRRSRHALWTRCQTAFRQAQGRVPVLSIPAECAWSEERRPDLHDALVNGDSGQVLELTSPLAEGAKRMVELTGACVHEDECKVWSPCFSSWGGV